MIRLMCAVAIAPFLILPFFWVGHAADFGRPLIWNVSRNGTSGVAIQTGVQLRNAFEPKIGVDTSIIATKSGQVDQSTLPVRLWGRVRLEGNDKTNGPATYLNTSFTPATGASSLSMERAWNWTLTPDFTLGSTRIIQVRRVSGDGAGLSASQRLDLSMPDWSASLYSEAGIDQLDATTTGSVGIEKKVFGDVGLSAAMTNLLDAPSTTFRASYSRHW
ncbi:hypothetical protein V6582_03185 [Agrobacterium vitis]|uniref:hypothetical protein n=1 Tax=Agrobacterium vitis TaxID=373 RepID=UPI0012E73328|nr:hypothetical protein [Agrobacterium vitis]MVA27603.1 hypothetical protein [Agrobacterium vitis]